MSGRLEHYKMLNFRGLPLYPDSRLRPVHKQMAGVKRLCRHAETLLSEQGRAAEAPLAVLASKELATKTSGFRDIHASKGSNRA